MTQMPYFFSEEACIKCIIVRAIMTSYELILSWFSRDLCQGIIINADIGDSLSIVLHAPRENDKNILCTLYLWNSFELFDNNISHTIPVKSTNIKLKIIQKKKKKSVILTQMFMPN